MKGLYIKIIVNILCACAWAHVYAYDGVYYIPTKAQITVANKLSLCVPMESKNVMLNREIVVPRPSSTMDVESAYNVSYNGGIYVTSEHSLKSLGTNGSVGHIASCASSGGKTSAVSNSLSAGVGNVSLSFVRHRKLQTLCTLADEEMQLAKRHGRGDMGGPGAGIVINDTPPPVPLDDGLLPLLLAVMVYVVVRRRVRRRVQCEK